jgi:hypothetical protein
MRDMRFPCHFGPLAYHTLKSGRWVPNILKNIFSLYSDEKTLLFSYYKSRGSAVGTTGLDD